LVERGPFMDDLLFAFKRVHLAGNRNAMKLLLAFRVTPARFDLMRVLYGNRTFSMQQSWLRAQLGVARATLSKMLKALEKLGLVERKTDEFDRRTKKVTLTYEARSLVWRVLVALVRTRELAKVIDAALEHTREPVDAATERRNVDSIATRLLARLARRWDSVHVAFDAC
jgi:DNA-binding MarR family transcriptional regulator